MPIFRVVRRAFEGVIFENGLTEIAKNISKPSAYSMPKFCLIFQDFGGGSSFFT